MAESGEILTLEPPEVCETPRGRKRAADSESPATVKLSPGRGAPPLVVQRLARELRETNTELLEKVVEHLGVNAALDCLQQTHKCMKNGGMKVASGTRKRTIGGVFFKLAQDQMSTETWKQICDGEARKKRQRKKHFDHIRAQAALQEKDATKVDSVDLVRQRPDVELIPLAPPPPAVQEASTADAAAQTEEFGAEKTAQIEELCAAKLAEIEALGAKKIAQIESSLAEQIARTEELRAANAQREAQASGVAALQVEVTAAPDELVTPTSEQGGETTPSP